MVNRIAVLSPDLKAGVAYYGAQPPAAQVPSIHAALLLHYAGLDSRINAGIPAYEAALKADGKSFEVHVYPNVNHAFNNDTSNRYDKPAADLAWSRTIAFFKDKSGRAAESVTPKRLKNRDKTVVRAPVLALGWRQQSARKSRAIKVQETTWKTQSPALIGAIIMVGYILLIAAKLAAPPLWIVLPDRARADAVGVLGRRLEAAVQPHEEKTKHARVPAALTPASYLDQPIRGAQQPGIVAGRADQLHAERHAALAGQQRQRQSRQAGQRPQRTEHRVAGRLAFRRDAGASPA